jgi:hypothetical protein
LRFVVITAVKIKIKEHVVYTKGNKVFALMWQEKPVCTEHMSQQGRRMGLKEGRMWNLKSNVISDNSETVIGAYFADC